MSAVEKWQNPHGVFGCAYVIGCAIRSTAAASPPFGTPLLLLLKLTLTPLVVTIATIVARRFGTRAGGMVTGLPLTAAPVSLFLALERGVPFAADAAMAMILSLISIAGFACGYRTAARWGWIAGVTAGFSTHFTMTALLYQLPFTLPVAVLAAGVIVFLALAYIGGRRHKAAKSQGSKFWELPLRMLVATTLVLVITTTAEAIGSRVAGLLTTLPIIASVIIVTAHRAGGPAEAVVAVRGHLLGSLSLGAFFAVLAATIEPEC